MTKISHLTAIAVLFAVALGGCTLFPKNSQWTEAMVVEEAWLKPRPLPVTPVYCYRTIATPVCYDWPVEHQASRIVGYSGPSPY